MAEQYTEEQGIEAIKFLQGLADVPETTDQAKRGWSRMDEQGRQFTMELYEKLRNSANPRGVAEAMIASNPEAQRIRARAMFAADVCNVKLGPDATADETARLADLLPASKREAWEARVREFNECEDEA